MRYHAIFHGRQVGAIGIFHRCEVVVEGETPEAARLALYQTHEHISGLTLTPQSGVAQICAECDAEAPYEQHAADCKTYAATVNQEGPTDDRPCGDCGAIYPEPHADDCANAEDDHQ
jgi:hypothetical protein